MEGLWGGERGRKGTRPREEATREKSEKRGGEGGNCLGGGGNPKEGQGAGTCRKGEGGGFKTNKKGKSVSSKRRKGGSEKWTGMGGADALGVAREEGSMESTGGR